MHEFVEQLHVMIACEDLAKIAELVGAISGVGYGLVIAQELFSVADVFAWTLVLVVILFLAEAVLSVVEERMLRWRT